MIKWFGVMPFTFGAITVGFLQVANPSSDPTFLLQYGALGFMVAAETAAIIWLAKKFITYLELTASKNAEALEKASDAMQQQTEVTKGLVDVVRELHKTVDQRGQQIDRLLERYTRPERRSP